MFGEFRGRNRLARISFYLAPKRATHKLICGSAIQLVMCWLKRILLWRRGFWIEEGGEGVGLAAIDEAGYKKLILESFGVVGAAKESEKAADLGVWMDYDVIVIGDGRHDQAAEGAAVAQGGGINRVEQFHAEESAFGKYAENVCGGRFHSGLQLEIHNGARGNLKRRNRRSGRERLRGVRSLGLRGKRRKSHGEGE
jgi:hypothetical protein